METKDISLSEKGSGGEISIKGDDLVLSESLYQLVYISLFGGNIEDITTGTEISTQQRNDYWANTLFHSDSPKKQFNSITEDTLRNTVLNSSGRIEIERAVIKDLEFLNEFSNYSVEVSILNQNRVEILIRITPFTNLQEQRLQLIFDNANEQLILQEEI